VLDRSAAGKWTAVRVYSASARQVFACALIPGTKSAWGAGRAAALTGTAADLRLAAAAAAVLLLSLVPVAGSALGDATRYT
jgi:hypothetical protein